MLSVTRLFPNRLSNLRGVLGIGDIAGRWGCGWGDSVHAGDDSWDASGDVLGSKGHWRGNWVSWDRSWVGHGSWGGGGARDGGVGIDNWGGHSAGVCLGWAVGHLRSAGSDGVNDGGALVCISTDSSRQTTQAALTVVL